MDDWVHVIPAEGTVADVAKALLALAESPAHVRTDGNGSEFLVPPYLAELYMTPPKPPAKRRSTKKDGDE